MHFLAFASLLSLALAAPVNKRDNPPSSVAADVMVISAAMVLPNTTQTNNVTYFYRAYQSR